MARGGVNKAVVQIARAAILARGEHPSIDAVRIEMGNTGSKTTIHRYLKELDDSDSRRGVSHEALGDELAELVTRLAHRLQEQAQEPIDRAQAQYEQLKTQLQAQLSEAQQTLSGLQQDLEIQATALHQESANLESTRSMLQTEQTRNAALNQACSDFELRLKDRDEQIRSLEENTSMRAMRLSITAALPKSSASKTSDAMKASCNRCKWNCVRHSKVPLYDRMKSHNCTAITNACSVRTVHWPRKSIRSTNSRKSWDNTTSN